MPASEYQTLVLGKSKLHVCVAGEQGPPLALVHGFPLDHRMWRFQIEACSNHARVIAIDLRGFGQSSGDVSDITMSDYADDCAAVLKALKVDEPVVLCGLSMGGYVAWQFWKRHRERLAGLVLCDTRAAADTEEVARGRRKMAFDVLARGSGFVADAMLPRLMAPETFDRFPDRIAELRQVIEATDPEAIAGAQRAMATRVDVYGWLKEIAVPSLVLCGVHDEVSRLDEMQDFASQMPDARFVAVPDAGHMAPLENPEPVNAAIQAFLKEMTV